MVDENPQLFSPTSFSDPQDQISGSSPPPIPKRRGLWWRLPGIGVVLVKFKTILIALKFGKFAATILSMLVMIWVYATQFGWWYASGFVLLIAVHESGHVLAARGAGLKVSMPIFIPFVGAFISMKQQPTNARHRGHYRFRRSDAGEHRRVCLPGAGPHVSQRTVSGALRIQGACSICSTLCRSTLLTEGES